MKELRVSPDTLVHNFSPEKFNSDFYLRFYDADNLKLPKIEHEVRAFFGEKLFQPRDEKIFVGNDGTLDPNYVQIMQNAVEYWHNKGDEKAANRFAKELEGAKNSVTLILESKSLGNSLTVIINSSDPGDYVDKEGNKKSVTFVWTLDSVEDGGWKYHVFSLPTKHIGLEDHWELLKTLGDLGLTEKILLQTLTEINSLNLIAFPVILDQVNNTLDSIALKLGFPSWQR
jgi:hypothetical protein